MDRQYCHRKRSFGKTPRSLFSFCGGILQGKPLKFQFTALDGSVQVKILIRSCKDPSMAIFYCYIFTLTLVHMNDDKNMASWNNLALKIVCEFKNTFNTLWVAGAKRNSKRWWWWLFLPTHCSQQNLELFDHVHNFSTLLPIFSVYLVCYPEFL